jgi:hypothetical protein
MSGTVEVFACQRIEHAAIRLVGEGTDDVTARPDRRRGLRRVCLGGIDPSREELFEPLVDPGAPEGSLDQGIEAERRQMALVEDDGMPKRDRLTVVGVAGEEIEEHPRPLAVAAIPGSEHRTIHTG